MSFINNSSLYYLFSSFNILLHIINTSLNRSWVI
nr:MAG TPA: hypothetical protein [Caudoviricetes sp.]